LGDVFFGVRRARCEMNEIVKLFLLVAVAWNEMNEMMEMNDPE
jgi:hypothetical protein